MTRDQVQVSLLQRNRFLLFSIISALVSGTSLACTVSQDPITLGGFIVDCRNQGLTSETIKTLDFPGTTSLTLNNNHIPVLRNNSFINYGDLRELVCEFCSMRHLEIDALKGLMKLEFLGLKNNRLKIIDNAFPHGVFRYAPRLKTLHIGYNENSGKAFNYSRFIDIFDSLPALEEISIDSFNNLRIGEEFARLTQLKALTLVCKHLNKISRNSFKGFQNSKVKHLALTNGKLYDTQIDHMTLQYLPNVSSLWLLDFSVGNVNALKMMQPLQGRRIDEIRFHSVLYSDMQNTDICLRDGSLTYENTRYLTNICVSRFIWTNSQAIAIGGKAFISDLWTKCLKSFRFVTYGTRPISETVSYFQLSRFRVLESFIFMMEESSIGDNFWNKGKHPPKNGYQKNYTAQTPSGPSNRVKREEKPWDWLHESQLVYRLIEDNLGTDVENRTASEMHGTAFKTLSLGRTTNLPPDGTLHKDSRVSIRKRSSVARVRIAPRLKTLVLDDAGTFRIHTDHIVSQNNLQNVYIRKNRGSGIEIKGKMLGFNRLAVMDVTQTQISTIPGFFKWFPSLTRLVLKETYRDSIFYSKSADDIPKLKYYDISNNDLVWLPGKTFRFNRALEYLSVSSNRFSNFPFDIRSTPKLRVLDIRMNSFTSLPLKDRKIIDEHVRHGHEMTILMDNNPFSCTCSALPFLKWLFVTSRVHFDKDGNYTCLSEDGTLSYTASRSDIRSFWRKCHGRYYFLISLILTFTLATAYLAAYLCAAHKTQILSKAMQLVTQDFRLQTRQDFVYDVCIGYADQDGDYVRRTLLRYLESTWHLKTFVHQRDLLHDPLLMSQAIRNSWRNVLLVTENFLDRHATAHNIMKVATFFVSPSNPSSVVVMVEESVRHRVPDYVLQVVHEDNIVVLPSLGPFLEYEAKETLKNRILC